MSEFIFVTVILVLGLGAYWSMVIFPKQRAFQKQQKYVQNLSAGDEVITFGGLIGKIVQIEAEQGIAHVEIADGVVVRMVSASLMRAYDPDELAENVRMATRSENR